MDFIIEKFKLTSYIGSDAVAVVPNEVNTIGRNAFCGFLNKLHNQNELNNLREVVLQDGITNIEESAFCFCYGLRKIEIPNKVTQLKRETFAGCKLLSQVILPMNLKKFTGLFLPTVNL